MHDALASGTHARRVGFEGSCRCRGRAEEQVLRGQSLCRSARAPTAHSLAKSQRLQCRFLVVCPATSFRFSGRTVGRSGQRHPRRNLGTYLPRDLSISGEMGSIFLHAPGLLKRCISFLPACLYISAYPACFSSSATCLPHHITPARVSLFSSGQGLRYIPAPKYLTES